MKSTVLVVLMSLASFATLASSQILASHCEQAAEAGTTKKFRNRDNGYYGYIQKIYDVKFNDSVGTCNVISVNFLGMDGI